MIKGSLNIIKKFNKKHRQTVASHPFSWEIPIEFALCIKLSYRINMARLWVDCFGYQSNTVILAELVFRGQSQPVHNLAS